MEVNQYLLEKVKILLSEQIDSYAMEQMQVAVGPTAYPIGNLILRIKREFFAELWVREVRLKYKVPAGWFQHFKKDHFPTWALKRWPVKYDEFEEVHEITRAHYFPNFYVDGHSERGHFEVREWESKEPIIVKTSTDGKADL